ncbi:MAG TPA: capsid cement protein [Gammaproteobacteria bacterium]|nr:capsid cement protein [Gammaproteobacteria bacterium]
MGRQALVNLALTLTASGAVSKFRAVGFDGAQASTAGQKVLGVALYDAIDGTDFPIGVDDTVLVEAGAAINVGDALTVDAQGRAVPASQLEVAAGGTAVTSTAANGAILQGSVPPEYIFADALEAASGAGDIIEVITRR